MTRDDSVDEVETAYLTYMPELPKLDLVVSALTTDLESGDAGFMWMNGPIALRILLSDYAITAATTCVQSVKEAALHLQEHQSALSDRLEVFRAHAKKLVDDGKPADLDPPSDERDLADLRRSIHMVGFFRAIGTSLDNIGALAAIVGALPICVVEHFTFPKFVWNMKRYREELSQLVQSDLLEVLANCSPSKDPDGWLEWSLEMRNMLVHRPRRLWFITTDLVDPSSGDATKGWSYMLPRSPEWSDVEIWRGASQIQDNFVLQESSVILNGVLLNASALIETLSTELSKLIFLRRGNPDSLTQPVEQWRKTVLPDQSNAGQFHGFGSPWILNNTEAITVSQMDHARFKSASFFDADARMRWVTWLADMTIAVEVANKSRKGTKRRPGNRPKSRGT